MELNVRERFLATMRFEESDRPPLCEFLGYWAETIQRWYREGLPIGTDIEEYFEFDRGLTPTPWRIPTPLSFSLSGLVDVGGEISIDFGPVPRYGPRVLEENEKYRVVVDGMGIKKKFLKGRITGMPQFLEYPVKERRDFEEMKNRFDPNDPKRYPVSWGSDMIDYYNKRGFALKVQFPGFFGFTRNLLGTERFLISFFRDPGLIWDIMDFWGDFVTEALEKVVERVKIDYATSWEDMAYKSGPHISPKLFREFILPQYKKVTGMLRRNGVDIILVDSDGNVEVLIPLFLEGGVNGIYPLEVQAGMDAFLLREKYGKRLLMIGNIDKKALIAGREAIRHEVESKVSKLIKEGGYIPSIDHEVPKDVSFSNYTYYINLLKRIYLKL